MTKPEPEPKKRLSSPVSNATDAERNAAVLQAQPPPRALLYPPPPDSKKRKSKRFRHIFSSFRETESPAEE